MNYRSPESSLAEAAIAGRGGRRWLQPGRNLLYNVPAVVVGGNGPGTLGIVRSLARADVPIILLDENALMPAIHSRYGRKFVIGRSSGMPLVNDLLSLAGEIGGPAVLFLTTDDAALTVSEYRARLENSYRFRLPNHDRLSRLMHKTSFQGLAEAHGFPVPRAVRIECVADLSKLSLLRFPAVIKPSIKTADYLKGRFPRAYKVGSLAQLEALCRLVLPTVPGLVVQEWIEGADSDLYFCLQYRGDDGKTVASFTGRKLSVWPPDVGTTASCTAAPEMQHILQPMTEAFFDQVSFIGMGGIEFKRDARTGEFVMIEPTVGRIDGQQEVATIHGTNIPLAAYLYETGLELPRVEQQAHPVIWRDYWADWRSARGNPPHPGVKPKTTVYDVYWRRDDPLPAFFHILGGSMKVLQRAVGRALRKPP
jgi:D-aspartate ligase